MKKIAVLGATGSVGSQALDIAEAFPEEIEIVCMTALGSVRELAGYANKFRPRVLGIKEEGDADSLKKLLVYNDVQIICDENYLIRSVESSNCDMAVHAVSGVAGLSVFEYCLLNGVSVALANKESLVCGADVVKSLMQRTGTQVLPVDSEHSAIFQCLGNTYDTTDVRRIWLTASGGPFLHFSKDKIDNASPEMALKHPNWNMGKKISVDSATLANKGLEVIEAYYMYGIEPKDIMVVIQPQSLIHSMVEMEDSSVLAQFAPIDMRLPLQKAMLYPKLYEFTVNKPLDFTKLGKIEFIAPDFTRFPCLGLAYEALYNNVTAAYCIADEAAVEAFLYKRISFGNISLVIEECMAHFSCEAYSSIGEILNAEKSIRSKAQEIITKINNPGRLY